VTSRTADRSAIAAERLALDLRRIVAGKPEGLTPIVGLMFDMLDAQLRGVESALPILRLLAEVEELEASGDDASLLESARAELAGLGGAP